MSIHRLTKSALALTVVMLAACGGGGGTAGQTFSLEGFAAKGTLKFAKVEVYTLDVNGKESTNPVKTGETTETGTYRIPDVGTIAGQQYIIKIKPNSRTKHIDEISGEQTLPSDFILTALTTTDNTTTSVGITPFSHMVVEAAKKADGGLISSNIAKAQSTVTELLGFNPASITSNDGSTEDAKKLKVMLKAVAQMAHDGAMGCNIAVDAGAKTRCVTDAMAAAATTTSLKLSTKNANNQAVDVSSAFASAIKATLVSDTTLSSDAMKQALAKLECTDNCTTAAPVNNTAKTAIAKVKEVVNEIRTDLNTMFSKGGATSTSKGKVNAQAFLFKQSVESVKLDVDHKIKDLKAITMGIQHFIDYKNGVTSNTSISSNYGQLAFFFNINPGSVNAVGCTLFKADPINSSVLPKDASEANFIGCSARYARTATIDSAKQQTIFVDYRHGFTLTPDANDSSKFTYRTNASTQAWNCPGTNTFALACTSAKVTKSLQGDPFYTGTVTYKAGTFLLAGDLAPGFQTKRNNNGGYDANSVSLLRDLGKDEWNLAVVNTQNIDGKNNLTLSGVLTSLDGNGNKLTELQLKQGSNLDEVTMTGKLDLSFSSFGSDNTAFLSGSLTADQPVIDSSKTVTMPTRLVFKGSLSNQKAGTSAVEFLAGSAEIFLKDYAKFDATKPDSASNSGTVEFTFKGSVVAPEQPKLELVFTTSGQVHDFQNTAKSASLSYNRWVGTSNTRAVIFTISRTPATATTAEVKTASITEATSGMSMAITEGAKTAEVKVNGSIIGSLNLDTGLLSFTDGSIVSLDIQL